MFLIFDSIWSFCKIQMYEFPHSKGGVTLDPFRFTRASAATARFQVTIQDPDSNFDWISRNKVGINRFCEFEGVPTATKFRTKKFKSNSF
ncbi:hypothetical protein AB3N59_10455 [Leptospira sp. WS92.C1]